AASWRAGRGQEPLRQGRGGGVEVAVASPGSWSAVRPLRGRVGAPPARGSAPRGTDGPADPVDRRDRKRIRFSGGAIDRWGALPADVRNTPDVDAGTARSGLPGRNRQRHRSPTTGASAQRTL